MMSAEAGSRKQPTNSKKTLMVSSTIQGCSMHAGDEGCGLLSDAADSQQPGIEPATEMMMKMSPVRYIARAAVSNSSVSVTSR